MTIVTLYQKIPAFPKATEIFNQLANLYIELHKRKGIDKTGQDFVAEVVDPMRLYGLENSPSLQKLMSYESNTITQVKQNTCMLLACVSCLYARDEHERGESDRAWQEVAEAQFWLGGLKMAVTEKISEEDIARASRRKVARDAANSMFIVHKSEVAQLFMELMPKERGWRSKASAAKAIHEKSLKNEGSAISRLKTDQAQKTIVKWFGEIPQTKEYFAGREKT